MTKIYFCIEISLGAERVQARICVLYTIVYIEYGYFEENFLAR